MDLAADANVTASADKLNEHLTTTRQTIRSLDQIADFFSGLEMVDPGLVQLPQWRPDAGYAGPAQNVTLSAYCGIGCKPLGLLAGRERDGRVYCLDLSAAIRAGRPQAGGMSATGTSARAAAPSPLASPT
jgi:hypothetical protein